MVTMESRQVRNVAELTVVISLSYFRQSMVANEAAGMAITAVLTQLSDKKLFSIIFRFRIDCKYLKIRDGVFRIYSKCKCSTPGIRKNVVHLPPCIWSYS